MTDKIALFKNKRIRSVWVETEEEWYFSVVDIISALTGSADAAAYWRKLKQRLKAEGNQPVTNCHGLKIPAADCKIRLTDAASIMRESRARTNRQQIVAS